MCFLQDASEPPKPAPIQRPSPQLEQEAPEETDEVSKKRRKASSGTKRYRAGSNLTIPKASSNSTGSLNIPG